jgi:hypothetical protein
VTIQTARAQKLEIQGEDWALWSAIIVCLCVATFVPLLDNPFVADDFVFLQRVELFKTDVLFLYDEAPLNYRMTTFLVFFLLKSLAGYTPQLFYVFTILLHAANCLLLRALLPLLGMERTEAVLAAIVFAVFHGPQEAVMWAVSMGENILGFCALAVLIAWLQQRYRLALLLYVVALFSKESAPVIWLLVLLLVWYRRERIASRQFLALTLLTAAFCVFFLWMWATNRFIQEGNYAVGSGALGVLVLSVHRLLWPWFYIALLLALVGRRRAVLRRIPAAIGLLVVTMAPYIFLTYSNALPSRHLYLASIVFSATVGGFLYQAPRGWRYAFLAVFIAFNIGVVWLRKDAQFELRAVPTRALIAQLENLRPQPILIRGFPYPYPEIAQTAALAVPGWLEKFIVVEGDGVCEGCPMLEWNERLGTYNVSGNR